MSHRPPDVDASFDDEDDEPGALQPVSVVDASSAFRLLLILVAAWSFIEGFALFTGGIQALSLDADRTAERIIGAQMLVLAPVFGLLAWRREQFRLLLWLPYAAQLAIIIPIAMAIFTGDGEGALLFLVSLIFFILLFYFWWHSHPLEHFAEELDDDEEDEPYEPDPTVDPLGRRTSPPRPATSGSVRSDAATDGAGGPRRPSRFRRRDP